MEGGQLMVVLIVAMAMGTGIITTWIDAKYGKGKSRRSRKHGRHQAPEMDTTELSDLNQRLDSVIDRLAVLEKIVTDEDRALKREFARMDNDPNSQPRA